MIAKPVKMTLLMVKTSLEIFVSLKYSWFVENFKFSNSKIKQVTKKVTKVTKSYKKVTKRSQKLQKFQKLKSYKVCN